MSNPASKNQQAEANTTPNQRGQVTQANTNKDPFAFMAQIQTKLRNTIQQNDKKYLEKIENTNVQMKQMKQKIKILQEQIQKIKKDRDHLKQKLKQAHQKLQIAQKLLFEKDITQRQLKKELEQLKEALNLRKKQQKLVNGDQSNQQKSQNKQVQERYKILSQKVEKIQKEKQQADKFVEQQQTEMLKLERKITQQTKIIKKLQRQVNTYKLNKQKSDIQNKKIARQLQRSQIKSSRKIQNNKDYLNNLIMNMCLQDNFYHAMKAYVAKQNTKIIKQWIQKTKPKPKQRFCKVIKAHFCSGDYYFINSDILALIHSSHSHQFQEVIQEFCLKIKGQSDKDHYYEDHKIKKITKHHVRVAKTNEIQDQQQIDFQKQEKRQQQYWNDDEL